MKNFKAQFNNLTERFSSLADITKRTTEAVADFKNAADAYRKSKAYSRMKFRGIFSK